jgi:SAM-dependent methyltransferase
MDDDGSRRPYPDDEGESMTMKTDEEIRALVRERYGEIARQGAPVPEAGCCGPKPNTIATRIGYAASDLDVVPDGANLGLGCGAPLAHAALRPGETVLDLGSGAGFDAFLAAHEVGPSGHVIGVDMTPDMLARARRNAEAAGHRNVEFREGNIEALPVADGSVDVVISNCVINLVPDKAAVYREVARVLRPGGRMIISDIVLEAPLPEPILSSVAALTGCVAGASLRADYLETVRAAGLEEVEVLEDRGFGEESLSMVPDDLRQQAERAGVDVLAVARTVRSIKVRARKPASGVASAPGRHVKTMLVLSAGVLAALLAHAPAEAAKARSKQAFAATAVDPDARGSAAFALASASQGSFKIKFRRLAPNASFDVVVNGMRVATLATNRGGKGHMSFRTRPRGKDLPLGFDPRGAAVVLRDAAGADVLVAAIPVVGPSIGAGELVCCVPDDSGPECEDRTQAECDAEGGTVVAGAPSCLPNPCPGAPSMGDDGDLVCCLPDDSGPECEDRTQAECLAGGGVVVRATSCVPEPCAPIAPPAGEVVCCLPDNGGDGAPECEDLTADACVAAGGAVVGGTSCTANPCGANGGGGGNPTVRVTCERRADRSRISVNGSNLAAGSYQGRALSGDQSATTLAATATGDQIEFDFDSEPDDIATGATAIAAGFLQGTPPQVTGQILAAGGAVLVESTVTCAQR